MEANRGVVSKLIEEYGVEATSEAKEALINFSVMFGEKLVRACILNKPTNRDIKSQDIRAAYESTKQLHSPEYEKELQQRKEALISNINESVLMSKDEDKDERPQHAAATAVTVKLLENNLGHMVMDKEKQLAFD